MDNNRKPSWRFIDVFFGFALYCLAITLGDVVLTKLNIMGNTFFVLISLIGSLVLFGTLMLFLNSDKNKDKISWDNKKFCHNLFIGSIFGSIFGFIGVVNILINDAFIFLLPFFEGSYGNYGLIISIRRIFFLIIFVLFIPVSEELFFRGWMFSTLKNKFHWIIAAFITALLSSFFLIANINFFFLILIGVAFAVLYEKNGSILTSTVSHMVCNLIIITMIWIKGGS